MVEKEMSSRKIKAEETRRKIYLSAEQLFNENGFEAVSIDDIVKKAGVAKGSFYVHYESKETLIAALIGDFVGRVDGEYQSYLDSLPLDMPLPEVFLAVIEKIADVLTEGIGRENMRLVYRIQLGNGIKTDAMISYNRGLYQVLHDILLRGVEQGVFRVSIPVEEMVKQSVVAFRGLTFEWCIRYPDFDLKEQAVQHFRILLKGICVL